MPKANPPHERYPRFAYACHKARAKDRYIEFLLSFEEWWAIWQESGKFEQRGRRVGEYVMARHEDTGPYAVGNVSIVTAEENCENNKSKRNERYLIYDKLTQKWVPLKTK